jgi:hypothetical protein
MVMKTPMVRAFKNEIKSLRKENAALKNLIYSLPEFRCKCGLAVKQKSNSKRESLRKVAFKQEKVGDQEKENIKMCVEDDDIAEIIENVKKVAVVDLVNDNKEEEVEEVVEEEEEEEEEVDELRELQKGLDRQDEDREEEGIGWTRLIASAVEKLKSFKVSFLVLFFPFPFFPPPPPELITDVKEADAVTSSSLLLLTLRTSSISTMSTIFKTLIRSSSKLYSCW